MTSCSLWQIKKRAESRLFSVSWLFEGHQWTCPSGKLCLNFNSINHKKETSKRLWSSFLLELKVTRSTNQAPNPTLLRKMQCFPFVFTQTACGPAAMVWWHGQMFCPPLDLVGMHPEGAKFFFEITSDALDGPWWSDFSFPSKVVTAKIPTTL